MTDGNNEPDSSSDAARVFWALREIPLHTMTSAQWQEYYPEMAPWLFDVDERIRECAVERLTTAVLWSEFGSNPTEDGQAEHARRRLAWLLDEVSQAHRLHHDVIPIFLHGLRYQLAHEPFKTPLLDWLDALACAPSEGVDAGLIQGIRLLIADPGENLPAAMAEWLGLLDHPSDYLRGCAAYLLGNASDDEDAVPNRQKLFDIIGAKERDRPGVAGPFWRPQHSGGMVLEKEQTEQAISWMLDLLEQRTGAPSPFLVWPLNDVEFYLHELCCFSPELMWRMLRGGHTALALMTATEMSERVDGVQPVLEALAKDDDPEIALRARNHLTAHYSNT